MIVDAVMLVVRVLQDLGPDTRLCLTTSPDGQARVVCTECDGLIVVQAHTMLLCSTFEDFFGIRNAIVKHAALHVSPSAVLEEIGRGSCPP